jgi:glycylpeptide N-tetradecanoyltransferase
MESHKFWDTQPILKPNDKFTRDGPIDKNLSPDQTQKELPADFEWVSLSLENVDKIADFLDKYYVEDPNHEFRLHYSPELLKWIYDKSNYKIVGVNVKKNNVLVGLICGKITKIQANKNILDMVEINFLCIHPKLRGKRLAPILIKEITRQFVSEGFHYAHYTNGNSLPTPIYNSKYYHRLLNIKKLAEVDFYRLEGNLTVEEIEKTHKLPDSFTIPNFVKIEERHLDQLFERFNEYMEKYNYHPIFTKEEMAHIFLNNNFVVCYVVEDDNGNVIDFISYYVLESRVLKSEKWQFIKKGYLYYYTCLGETSFKLIKNILIAAKNNEIDVMNALDIMENGCIFDELRFGMGNGSLYYYLYNWRIRPLKNIQIATILL